MRIAIYDLDRTITAAPTFTPFLAFAARQIAPWRLSLLPVWVGAMIVYRAGLCSRTALKGFGMRMMAGRAEVERLREIGAEYAHRRIAAPGLQAPVMRLVKEDRAAGSQLVLATAAFDFYARSFAEKLDFPTCIATGWDGEGIPGGNCYGEVKKARVLAWLAEQGFEREDVVLRFVSDSFADAPLLELADEPIFVTTSSKQSARASARGWRVLDPR